MELFNFDDSFIGRKVQNSFTQRTRTQIEVDKTNCQQYAPEYCKDLQTTDVEPLNIQIKL